LPVSDPRPDDSDRFAELGGAELSEAIERHYDEAFRARVREDVLTQVTRALRTACKREERKLDKVMADLERAEDASALSARAELLKASLHRIPRGSREVEVTDFYDPELRTVTVPLDPAVDPREQVQRMFHRARRLTAASAQIAERADRVEARIAALRALLAEAAALSDDADPTVLAQRAVALGVKVERPAPPGVREQEARKIYREFTAADGTPIFVGKGARENDQLTLRVARSDDLWLHALGRPGAHVILRLERGRDPTPEALLDAAQLAAHYARAGKTDTAVEVGYTRRRYVRKGKGHAPGEVSLSKVKAILVAPDEERLRRLFGSEG
jgi:predicted ribosome quality control (RQC) complex YloA/Tae2 family protein